METQANQFLKNSKRINDALGDPIPQATPALIEAADRAVDGEVCRAADGTFAKFDLDNPIDWTCATTHNPGVVVMHLLRFACLVPLASAFRGTGDERYARAARRYIEAFLHNHPITDDWKPAKYDGATQYELRVGASECPGWLGSLHAFIESVAFDDAFLETLFAACRAHLNYLSAHIYPDRNIRVMNGDVLIINGVRLAFLPEANTWREIGVRVINDGLARQILPDGAHMEACPGYHGIVMHLFAKVWRYAKALPELGIEVPTQRVAAMFDYSLATSRPDGAMTTMHDTGYSPPRVANSTSIRDERATFRQLAGLPDEMPPTRQYFPDAGQAFLRESWGTNASYLTFDATERRSFHWHPSRNTIQFFANGRALLIDTGYPFKSDEFPSYGGRTAHHSTLNLNGWNQSHATTKLRARHAPEYDLIEGRYDGGYWPQDSYSYGEGIFGEHYRAVLWLRNRCVVVLDQMYTTSDEGKKPSVESVWQLSEGGAAVDPVARSVVTTHEEANLLMLFPLTPAGTTISIHSGEREPMRGWVPVEWGRRCAPAPMVRLETRAYDPWTAHFATVLVPFAGADAPRVVATATPPDMGFGGREAGKLDLKWPDGSSDLVVWIRKLENAIGQQHGLDTDASLVHLQRDAGGRLIRGMVADGRYLRCSALGPRDLIDRVERC